MASDAPTARGGPGGLHDPVRSTSFRPVGAWTARCGGCGSISGGGYLALYRLDGSCVVVLAVRHGREMGSRGVLERPHARAGLSFPPGYGGVGSECHAAARMAIPPMLARASTGVR